MKEIRWSLCFLISGLDEENWLEAERIVLERLLVRKPSKEVKKPLSTKITSATT
jgi:hypothetical protein